MLTINADAHPIFKELHRPDPKRPADKQDKRMVVILNSDAYDAWLDAPAEKSAEFCGISLPISCARWLSRLRHQSTIC